MLPHLDNVPMQQLQKALENALFGCAITVPIEKKDTKRQSKADRCFCFSKAD